MGGLDFGLRSRVVSADAGQDFYPGQGPATRQASTGLTAEVVGEEVMTVEKVVCDRPSAAQVLLRPCVSLDWSSKSRSLEATSPNVARTKSPHRAWKGRDRGEEDDARSFLLEWTSRKIGLDVAFRPGGEKLIVPSDRRGVTRLVRTTSRLEPECVALGPSDGFERKLLERLSAKGQKFKVTQALQWLQRFDRTAIAEIQSFGGL
jgi:hypothetical protein